jgi:hypothetical protein
MLLSCIGVILVYADTAEEDIPAVDTELLTNDALSDFSVCATDDGEYAYIDFPTQHILPNQTFVVPFIVNSESVIEDYSFNTDGLAVLHSELVSDSIVSFRLCSMSDETEGKLTVFINMTNEGQFEVNLYAYIATNGVYLSQTMYDDAYSKYIQYSVEAEEMTEEEGRDLYMEYLRQFVTIDDTPIPASAMPKTMSTMSTNSAADTHVAGYIRWEDSDGDLNYLRNVKIEVYDNGTFDTLVGTTYTNDDGYYILGFVNADNPRGPNYGHNIYIRVYAGDGNIDVKNSLHIKYYIESVKDARMNVVTGTTVPLSLTFDTDSTAKRAMEIYQAAMTAREFAFEMNDTLPSSLTVLYPSIGGMCNYYDIIHVINIPGTDLLVGRPAAYESWDVIMHEYGHHISADLDISDSPGKTHYLNASMVDHYWQSNHAGCECANPGAANAKREGMRIAWSEGWATTFGLIAQQYFSSYLTDVATTRNSLYQAFNLQSDYDIDDTGGSYLLGDGCELTISAVLWDVYDGETETNDTIALGYQAWWDITTGYAAKTLADFMVDFYAVYPNYKDDIGLNLTYYQMAPSKVSLSPPATTLTNSPPTFTWTAQGGSEHFPNNIFELKFYNTVGTLMLTIETTNTFCELTAAQWSSARAGSGSTIRVCVAVKKTGGTPTGNPIMGEYESEYTTYNKP